MRITDRMIGATVAKAEALGMLNVSPRRARSLIVAALDAMDTHHGHHGHGRHADRDLDRYGDHGAWQLGEDGE